MATFKFSDDDDSRKLSEVDDLEKFYKIEFKACKDCIVRMLCNKICELCETEIQNRFRIKQHE